EGSQETPTLKDERVPTKEELKRIFLAADPQQRVACVLLAHAGLRPESLGNYEGNYGLKVCDLPEIEVHPRKHELIFKKIPSIVVVIPIISKAGHQYFSFLTSEGCQYAKEYLEKRMRQGEPLDHNSPILTPQKDSTSKKVGSHITTTNVGDMIRSAIRKAVFKWRPYVLRSFFDTQLMIAESKGLTLRDHRTFFMGHKADIKNRYTANKGRLPEQVIEHMRSSFKKASE
ncbi:MAG: site-specific integrase, partial [Nitrososphaerales archaeon]